MSETSMKPWQQGYPLTELQDIEARYASYNARARGPFSTMKAHQLAVPLAAGELIVGLEDAREQARHGHRTRDHGGGGRA